jgi:hypothetical protein
MIINTHCALLRSHTSPVHIQYGTFITVASFMTGMVLYGLRILTGSRTQWTTTVALTLRTLRTTCFWS